MAPRLENESCTYAPGYCAPHGVLAPVDDGSDSRTTVEVVPELFDQVPRLSFDLRSALQELDPPDMPIESDHAADEQDIYTLGSIRADGSSSFPCSFTTETESVSNVETLGTPLSSPEESSPCVKITTTPPDPTLDLHIEADVGTRKKIDEFNLDLPSECDAAQSNSNCLSPVARDAIRGRVPQLPRPSLSPEPSETDITDNGNHLHDLKSQGRTFPSVDHTEPEEPLQNRLIDSLQETPEYPERKGFFPRDLLASLVDTDCVYNELRSYFQNVLDDDTILNCAQKICGISAHSNERGSSLPLFKKVFVTLVLSEKMSAILKFIAANVTDEDLPLSKVHFGPKASGRFRLGRRSTPEVPLECFRGWTSVAIQRFEEWQWTTISPFFAQSYKRKNVNHFVLQDQVILPFLSDSRREANAFERFEFDGGFSQVFKVDIHPEHHDFHDPQGIKHHFAVKCLLSCDREDFNREVEMLKKFSGNSHDHLVSLLATYEQFKRFYLIFHWADSDLQDYWMETNPRPTRDHRTSLWLAQQCKGIADGLSRIHHYESSSSKVHQTLSPKSPVQFGKTLELPRPQAQAHSMEPIYGRHGDIKPANVLLFRDPTKHDHMGILKLTDFGLAEFSTLHSKSGKSKPQKPLAHE